MGWRLPQLDKANVVGIIGTDGFLADRMQNLY